ncbi:MAG TPA: exodeoxyribonuclease V subunit gamma, partial [bacterium]
ASGFPRRIAVFGISALPRFHVQIFQAIAHFTEVNFFILNPCQEYWSDILSDREAKRVTDRAAKPQVDSDQLHLELGNPLLASMGKLGRDFFDLILELDPQQLECFEAPGGSNLFATIQSDILNLINPDQIGEKRMIAQNDTSIQVHSCHSPMREIEVLHDQMLKLFEQNSDLLPKDILVMTPDIETYAPYIQAVFDLPENDPKRIPFSIADRSARSEGEIIGTFMAILELAGSRFAASQVIAILENESVQQKFQLTHSDLELTRQWIQDTRIRWGIDAKHRKEFGLPEISENTWRAGLERLLLGYAMPGQDENIFAGILPYDHIEGNDTIVLGKFLDFVDQLFAAARSIDRLKTLNEWTDLLLKILDGFFSIDDEKTREFQMIRQAINDLVKMETLADFKATVDISVIKCYLKDNFEKSGFGYGFISGGVTFCAMLPMRSIPAKVICLIGMNGDSYPRQNKRLGFDLMAKHPQPGDRSRRNDDRYLFLEALLSAREKLYISFVGQSIQDNSIIPPSVLVSELLDYVEKSFQIEGKNLIDNILTTHRLQTFSPEYFKNIPKLFSFSNENFQAARQLLEQRQAPTPFITTGLSSPEDDWKTVSISDLCSFFSNPVRYLLNKRLGIYLGQGAAILEETESFAIRGLDRYVLEQALVEKKLDDRDLKEFYFAAQASGQLPHGVVGDCIYEDLSKGVENFVEKTKAYISGTALATLEVDLKILDFNLIGRIDSIYPERLIQFRYARVKARDRLKLWIYHLALNAIQTDHYPKTSMLVALDPVWAAWEFPPVENSNELLAELLQIYWQGLMKPLHFFPESSWEYAQQVVEKNKIPEEARRIASAKWSGSDFSRGEGNDLYYQQCFRNSVPIDTEFQELSLNIFKPILENQQKIE